MKLHHALLIALAPMLVSGCYGSSESFASKSSKLFCETLEECNKSQFENQYSSMADCIDTNTENTIDNASTCEYDPDQGRECIKVTKQLLTGNCDPNLDELQELARACEDVYYSCGNGGVGLGWDPMTNDVYFTSIDEP